MGGDLIMAKKRFRLGSNPLEWIKSTTVSKDNNKYRRDREKEKEAANETRESPVFETVFFQPHWEEAGVECKERIQGSRSTFLLVLADGEDILPAISKSVGNENVILVKPGNGYRKEDIRKFEINIRDLENYRRLAADLVRRRRVPEKILHLWSWPGAELGFSPGKEGLDEQLDRGIYSLFYLTRALMEQKPGDQMKLLYVYPIPGDKNQSYCAFEAVSSFIRTLRLENPNFLYKTVGIRDLSCSFFPDKLLTEFELPAEPAEIRFQGKEKLRLVRRLKEIEPPGDTGNPLPLKENGVYIITGGTGKLGMIFAKYLVEKVNANVVLIGRSQLNLEKEAVVSQLRSSCAQGSDVLYMKADVARSREVSEAAKKIKSRFKEINGIIHCAGVKHDAFILKKTSRQIRSVLAPKVYGTVLLDEALSREKLDFFVICSSLSAVMSNVGQCDYAYANGFIDAFAHWRGRLEKEQKRCGRTISINWPLWDEGGMQVSGQDRLIMREQAGLVAMPTQQGINILEKALRSDKHQHIATFGQREKLKIVFEQTAPAPPPQPPLAPIDTSYLEQVDLAQLTEKTQDFLKQVFGEIIKLSPRQIHPKVRFEEYGIDSIMVTQFNTKIEKELGSISKTLLFEHQTLEELTRYFLEHHGSQFVDFFQLQVREKQEEAPRKPVVEEISVEPWPELKPLKEKYLRQSIRWSGESKEIEDIAVIGLSGRYPMAGDTAEFWNNLKQGKDCITEIPPNRWDYQRFWEPGTGNSSIYCRWGGFLENIDQFDPLLFNISPREAANIDPQERLFLETVWATLEDAGYTRKEIGTEVGVYVGITTHTYHQLGPGDRCPNSWSAANRVSFVFNFHGPSMPVDTACSSSLTALHLACESLKKRECQFAIAGGVNLYLYPSRYREMCTIKMLSYSGKCHTFGEKADGFVPGEGVGAVLLKPLRDAVKDKDHIYAVIKSTSINHGGRTNGYTVPNPNAQGDLIQDALEKAGIDPGTINYVETHGTGTILGDPVEISGLIKAYGKYTDKKQYCSIGSVKTNIGHLESAAGIAGLTKILLQMKHRQLVPSLNAKNLNPNIDFENSPFYPQQGLTEWKPLVIRDRETEKSSPLRAGLSSFGAGGANVHVILEEAPQAANGQGLANIGKPMSQHAIKEEYAGLAADTLYPPPYLIILSARNERQLNAYAVSLLYFLEKEPPINSCNIAYTLQVGREPMNERLAVIVSHQEELKDKLNRYCQGNTDIDKFYKGNTRTDKSLLERLLTGDAGENFIKRLVKERDFQRIAELWVSGLQIDWKLLYTNGSPNRTALPTYPFAREQYWITPGPGSGPSYKNCYSHPFHPLIDSIDARQSLDNGLVFLKTLQKANLLVSHHQVLGQAVFPGTAYLEMACAVLSRLFPGEPVRLDILNVVFLQPLTVTGEIRQIRVMIRKNKRTFHFEFMSPGPEGQSPTLHARAQVQVFPLSTAVSGTGEERLAIEAIKSRCSSQIDRSTLYAGYKKMGLNYGPYFQVVSQVYTNVNGGEALAYFYLSQRYESELTHYMLHPVLLDGALHSLAGVKTSSGKDTNKTFIPFSIEKAEVFHPLPQKGYAYAKTAPGTNQHRFHVAVLDETGKICVKLHDVTVLESKKTSREEPGMSRENFYFKPRWVLQPLTITHVREKEKPGQGMIKKTIVVVYSPPAPGLEKTLASLHPDDNVITIKLGSRENLDSKEHKEVDAHDFQALDRCIGQLDQLQRIYFLGGIIARPFDINHLEILDNTRERGIISLLRLVKALSHHGYARAHLHLFVVTNDVHTVMPEEIAIPYSAGLHGLTGSIAKEFPQWSLRCVDISLKDIREAETLQQIAAAILEEPANPSGEVVVLRKGKRYIRKIEPVLLPPVTPTPFKQRGVYMILGGVGGIGLELGLYLARTVQAHLVLVDRLDQTRLNADQQQKISMIESSGAEVLYLQADIKDIDHMAAAVTAARERFGRINGVFHSALVLKDRLLQNMDEETFQAVLAPKIEGSVVLLKALEKEPQEPDFIMFFSSAQSFTCTAGQGNYAAACTFKDAFARYLSQEKTFPIKIINWGYWGTVGAVSSQAYNKRWASRGILSITPKDGMEAIERILAHPLQQVMFFKAQPQVFKTMGIDLNHCLTLYPPNIPSLIEETARQMESGLNHTVDWKKQEEETSVLHKFMEYLLFKTFWQMDVLQTADQTYDKQQVRHQLKILPRYYRLYDALLDILAGAGFVELNQNQVHTTQKPGQKKVKNTLAALEKTKEQLMETYPGIAPHVKMVHACVTALPGVLSGRKNYMEVMFPRGSTELVEPIYKGNPAADFYNQLAARTIKTYIRLRLQTKPTAAIHILEVGAGTGGTTVFVIDAVNEYAKNLHYIYSDISPKFVQLGEKTFGAGNLHSYPFMEFRVLDLEKDAVQQEYEPNSLDIILAANVLHATRNIQDTLNRLKTLLKTNGLLIINEITRKEDFSTLTFGLTDGWWHYKDEENRIKGSPLLNPEQWQQVMESTGIRHLHFLHSPEKTRKQAGQHIIIGESNGEVNLERPVSDQPAQAAPQNVNKVQPVITAPTPGSHPGREVEEIITSILAQTLHINKTEFDPEASFQNYGVDSLVAVEIIDKINKQTGMHLRATDLFNYSTIRELSMHMVNHPEYKESRNEPRENTANTVADIEPGMEKGTEEAVISSSLFPGRSPGNDIAIIGISCQFPGAADMDEFWDNLAAGKNTVTKVPPSRWHANEIDLFDNQQGIEGMQSGGFLSGIDEFDARFFHISRAEAEVMDPQQRLFLQESWRALEDAGYSAGDLYGKTCAVFVGCGGSDYTIKLREELQKPISYSFMGNADSILPARVSYHLNLKGPATAVDTACSSSLTALHLACEALRNGSSDLAIAGGVTISTTPTFHLLAGISGMLSRDGQCKTFDDTADGFVPGEGVGVVVVKPLWAALQEKDHIYGIIKGSGMNHNGKTIGITAPNATAQTALECDVYNTYHINPETIGYVEAHGTGTKLGDAVEIHALTDAFGKYSRKKQFCAIGSVKTNIGHTLAAAGAASIIKVILAFKHKQIPPSLHFNTPNHHIDFKNTPFYVNTTLTHWRHSTTGNPRCAAISAFGFSGTNAHLVLEEPPEPPTGLPLNPVPYYLIPISAKTTSALKQKYKDLLKWLETNPEEPIGNIAYTLQAGRTHFSIRSALIVTDGQDLKQSLNTLCTGEKVQHHFFQNAASKIPPQEDQQEMAVRLINEINALDPDQGKQYKEKLSQLAHYYISGCDMDWSAFYQEEGNHRISLPTYPFDRKTYWVHKDSGESNREDPPESNEIRELIHQLKNGKISVSAAEVLIEEWQ
jgi:acyl transferase domain-containing protein/acyl carrier protein/ubiquinone/menaquinone biosynthesis C-methylase UbiE